MAKGTETQFTDENLLAEVQAELDAMSAEDLEAAAHEALVQTEVRKAKQKARVQSEEQKAKQRAYNRKRNMKMKLLAQKAAEAGIEVSEREVKARLDAGS